LSKRRPRVLIVYNQPVLPADHPDAPSESDVLESVAEVEKVLPPAEFEVARLGYARDPRVLIRKVRAWKPDAVFNLFEGEADRTATEVYHAAVLEWLGVPFTGCPSAALALGRDKVRTKYLLNGAGLPTALFRVVEVPGAVEWPGPWPAFVKPACQDASVGIDQGSVVRSAAELDARVRLVFERYGGPVLVEEYLAGREFHVHVVDDPAGLVVLPPTEIRFQAGDGYWPVYTFEGKWNEQSVEFKSTPLDTTVVVPAELMGRIEDVCRAVYRLVGLRDYGRVDLRVTSDGRPFVLEVNPNPYLNSVALVDGLRRVGRQFPEFIQGLVRSALGRGVGRTTGR
jgi:D-alanine-D-alanine ligase